MFKQAKFSLIALSIAYVLMGGVLIGYPGNSLKTLCVLVGLVVLAYGVRLLVQYARMPGAFFLRHLSLVGGIVCCAVGVFLLLRPSVIIGAIPIVFGLFIIFDSLVRLGDAWMLRRTGSGFGSMLLLVVLSCALGAVMIYNPFATAEAMVMAVGVILLLEGVLNLCTTGYVHFTLRAWNKAHPEVLEAESEKAEIDGEAPAVDVEFRDVAEAAPETTEEEPPVSGDTIPPFEK